MNVWNIDNNEISYNRHSEVNQINSLTEVFKVQTLKYIQRMLLKKRTSGKIIVKVFFPMSNYSIFHKTKLVKSIFLKPFDNNVYVLQNFIQQRIIRQIIRSTKIRSIEISSTNLRSTKFSSTKTCSIDAIWI